MALEHQADAFNGPIQSIPEGLLSFFQLKNQGRNPHELGQVVQPDFEMRDWYFASRAVVTTATVNVIAGTLNFYEFTAPVGGLVVPNTELWYIVDYSLIVGLAAGETLYATAAYLAPNGTGTFVVGAANQVTGVASMIFRADRSFFMPSGHKLGLFVTSTAGAGPFEVTAWLRYIRLSL